MQIRRLVAEDARVYQEFRLAALQECPTAFSSSFEEERNRSQAQVAHFLSGSPEQVFFGAFSQNRLVGAVRVGRESALKVQHTGFIRSMYVAPSSRGRGIGAAILHEALAMAAGWIGLEQLSLSVTAISTPAIALYLHAGFVECGRMPRAIFVDGSYHDELHMVRFQSASRR